MTKNILPPTVIVIFGGTGDLAKTKLFPALLDLYVAGELPKSFSIIGLSRKELSDVEYQALVRTSIKAVGHNHSDDLVKEFCVHIKYASGNFDKPEAYETIKTVLKKYDESIGQCTNKLFYLAVPPEYYEVIFTNLASSKAMALCDNRDSWSRLLVEKPFGRDLATALELEKKLCSLFRDEQIYRIDHYLAKDAIENIIALRFANTVLADSWDGEAIESIDIRLLETKDVSSRGSFYDAIGTLRDVGQNHLMQIFALLTMPVVDMHDPNAIRQARASALRSLENQQMHTISRGQYTGYNETEGVTAHSDTETYFKLEFSLESGVWQDTKFTLEAGKALSEQVNEAVIVFRSKNICHCSSQPGEHKHQNILKIRFSPQQHISLSMWTKQPGFTFALREQELILVEDDGEDCHSPEAYERVLFDCIAGDQTRFVSGDEVELAWKFITPILEQFKNLPLLTYEPGSAGPETNY